MAVVTKQMDGLARRAVVMHYTTVSTVLCCAVLGDGWAGTDWLDWIV